MAEINITCEDNIDLMARYDDNYFDLAIVDPPYGLDCFDKPESKSDRIDKSGKISKWDTKPNDDYFKELFRVSKTQIIWGANNFTLPPTEYFIIWNKLQTVNNFASCEYAWTNYKQPAKVFNFSIHKTMSERKSEGGKIHPTQKPIQLYQWLLENYAKENDKILDTHIGSGSIAIACDKLGYDLTACEIDREYYKDCMERLKLHQDQLKLF